MNVTTKIAYAAAAMIMIAGAIGCTPPEMAIEGASATLPADDGSAAYLDRVSTMQNVSQNEAMRGILMLLEIDDAKDTFQQRVAKLRDRGLVDPSWRLQADRPITRGQAAYMIYQACDMRGGVILTLTGPSQRYCLRELQYRSLFSQGAVFTALSGGEYIATLGRADSYLQEGGLPEIRKVSRGW